MYEQNYLKIDEPAIFDTSVIKEEYSIVDPQSGTDINASGNIILTQFQSNNFLRTSDSWLYVEGQVVKTNGTVFTKDDLGNWPDVALTNNFFPYLFSQMTYILGEAEVESFQYPGVATTMTSLLLKPRIWNALDIGWELDTFDGAADVVDYMYSAILVPYNDMVGGTPMTPAEYRANMRLIIGYFNILNSTAVTNATDAQLPCAATPVTQAEVLTGINNIVGILNNVLENPPIPDFVIGDVPTDPVTIGKIKDFISITACTKINKYVVNRNAISNKYNEGFVKRKNLLFNNVPNVMQNNNAGRFTFKIPLRHLFSFSDGYDKVIFNCKHELRLNRQTDDYALFRSQYADAGKVRLDRLRWYIPVITPNNLNSEMLKEKILSGIPYDVPFIGRKIDQAFDLYGKTQYSMQITYQGGVEKPRFIVSAFQSNSIPNPAIQSPQQVVNNSIFNGNTSANMVDVRTIIVKINGKISTTVDFDNYLDTAKIIRWYNEYKNFVKQYYNDMTEENMIDYFSFRNLYRLYVIDISKEVESFTDPVVSVVLDYYFNKPVDTSANSYVQLFVESFYDRLFKISSDGTKQIIVK